MASRGQVRVARMRGRGAAGRGRQRPQPPSHPRTQERVLGLSRRGPILSASPEAGGGGVPASPGLGDRLQPAPVGKGRGGPARVRRRWWRLLELRIPPSPPYSGLRTDPALPCLACALCEAGTHPCSLEWPRRPGEGCRQRAVAAMPHLGFLSTAHCAPSQICDLRL